MSVHNLVDVMCILPGLVSEFLDTTQRLELATLNRHCAIAFGSNLDQETHDVLKDINNNGWFIQTYIEGRTLTRLYMRKDREVTGDTRIPESVCQLTTLKELVVRCGAGGEVTGGIPENIGNLANLEVFDAEAVGLTSGFPDSMSRLDKLCRINLLGNTITHDIPDSWFQETGPLRSLNSRTEIWRTTRDGYVGSILNMPEEYRRTTFTQVGTNDWVAQPVLCRSMGMRSVKMWYGSEWM
jgi:hypothetical protein